MILFTKLADSHASFLACLFEASTNPAAMVDDKFALYQEGGNACLVERDALPKDTSGNARPQLEFLSLSKLFEDCGLNDKNDLHRMIVWGFRNALLRDQRGESWLPAFATKLVRKQIEFIVFPLPAAEPSYVLMRASATKLVVESINEAIPNQLIVEVEQQPLVELISRGGGSKAWREWLRSSNVRFRQHPLWLKILLKLV